MLRKDPLKEIAPGGFSTARAAILTRKCMEMHSSNQTRVISHPGSNFQCHGNIGLASVAKKLAESRTEIMNGRRKQLAHTYERVLERRGVRVNVLSDTRIHFHVLSFQFTSSILFSVLIGTFAALVTLDVSRAFVVFCCHHSMR